ncbi:Cytochrome c, mono-and diheme variants [Albimonas donghaensis]|uniref:Cytochrome c, mono-and diheme variants n=1 Tax=Albimonas donghaensis TaxID=356660 RepID=A0A1H3F3U8_9RHOB|nr:cytochrome c [Albimonas donghaensis]SDX84869.1 Cytochrome c, mono-and diheme variants [Albimonas donghaensis]
MLRRALLVAAGIAAAGLGGGLWLTAPRPIEAAAIPAGWSPDAEARARGARLFALGSCASCHADPEASGEERLVLKGGRRFETGFGTFVAPNISQDVAAGIGAWGPAEFASAFLRGVGAEGEHLYPAFPWASYGRLELADALDLFAYLRTLPADPTPSRPHELGFPFSVRAGLGAWKLLYFDPDWVVTEGLSASAERGRRLVEGIGHCGECHTPRNALGGPEPAKWMGGGPNPDGPGTIPDISPSGLGGWSEADIAYFLESGFTPDYDSVGGSMTAVVEETAKLDPQDREDIAAYLKAIPPAN